jgi:hypothetical protein
VLPYKHTLTVCCCGFVSSPQILWDDSSRQYVLPYKHLTKLGEVRTELQLLDAADNWAFLGWLMDERRMQVSLFATCSRLGSVTTLRR